jgi:arsenite methyltransferase
LKKCKVIGVNIWSRTALSGNQIENAKIERVADRVEFKTADARKLPFPDKCFNVIVCSFVLHHVGKEWRKALKEIVRVLKKNGKLVISEISWGPWSKKNMIGALEKLDASAIQFHSMGFSGHIIYAIKTAS